MGVRVPRITLKADYDEGVSFGELRLMSVGYGLHQAWIYATMFGSAGIFGVDALSATGTNQVIPFVYVISILFYAAALLFASFTDQRFLSVYVGRRTLGIAAAVTCVGSLALLLPSYGIMDGLMAQVIAGVLTGLGSATLILQWGVAFAQHDHSTAVTNTAVALAVGVVVYALVLCRLPFPAGGVIAALLPLVEVPFVAHEVPAVYAQRRSNPVFLPLPVKRNAFVLKFGLPVALFGIALGMFRQTSVQGILPGEDLAEQLMIVLAACCVLVLMLITLLALNAASRWNRLFRPLVPVIAVVAFFLPLAEVDTVPAASLVLLVGYLSFEAMLWISFAELSQEYRLSPVLVFGLGRGVLALASLLGSVAPVMTMIEEGALPFGPEILVALLLLAMMFGYMLLPREGELRDIILNCPLTDALRDGSLDSDAARLGTDITNGDAAGVVNEAHAAEEHAVAQPMPDCEEEGRDSAALSGKAKAAPLPNSIESAGRGCDVPVEPGSGAAFAHASKDATEGQHPSPSAASSQSQGGIGRFKRKCAVVANRYLLSQRESEVLFLLAKGYNVSSIQERLYISEGTAKTHIRHIYRKLDVHSQQEAIQLVEGAEVE